MCSILEHAYDGHMSSIKYIVFFHPLFPNSGIYTLIENQVDIYYGFRHMTSKPKSRVLFEELHGLGKATSWIRYFQGVMVFAFGCYKISKNSDTNAGNFKILLSIGAKISPVACTVFTRLEAGASIP